METRYIADNRNQAAGEKDNRLEMYQQKIYK